MKLLTVHKIFIAMAAVLFVLLTRWEYANYRHGKDGALALAVFSAAGAVGLVLYLRWLWLQDRRSNHRQSDDERATDYRTTDYQE